uniref:Putative rna-binding protein p54nrb rrm superfamily n=1 Tax=Xenopsylla cheopis TaxID=163159 RepID=A0A6M2DV18_XENCH
MAAAMQDKMKNEPVITSNGPQHKKPNQPNQQVGNNNRGGRGGGNNKFMGRGGLFNRNQNRNNQNQQANQGQHQNQDGQNKIKTEDMGMKKEDGMKGGMPPRGMNRGPPNMASGAIRRSEEHLLLQKLQALSGPVLELPSLEMGEIKFSGRSRLYIGNLTNDVTEEEVIEMFKPYGETSEHFINKEKNFGFIRLDFRASAEKAKRELDGKVRKGRPLRVRFAPNSTAIKVKNLTPWVSNELLYKAFEIFGPIERCIISCDERGKSTGEGIVEYQRKNGAMAALRHCQERCFFLTSSLRPVIVEPFDFIDDVDGVQEKNMLKKNPDFFKARQAGPRFADIGSFEHEYGTRWKQLHELYKQKSDALKREMLMEEEKLEAQMEFARYEHETEMLREELRLREQDRDRQKREWELKERQADEQRTRDEELMRRQQEEMQVRMLHQEEELRRRQQENTLFMQAQQLNSMLDQQEQGFNSPRPEFDDGNGGGSRGGVGSGMQEVLSYG